MKKTDFWAKVSFWKFKKSDFWTNVSVWELLDFKLNEISTDCRIFENLRDIISNKK